MSGQRQQRVLERGSGPTKAKKKAGGGQRPVRRGRAAQTTRQAINLRDALFDQDRLATQTYLTIPELCAYGRFETEHAARQFLTRKAHLIPKCRQGRKVTILRRDFDRAVQPVRADRHGKQSPTSAVSTSSELSSLPVEA